MPSVQTIKKIKPLYFGQPNRNPLKKDKAMDEDSEDYELDSEEEKEKNKPYFENMPYWVWKRDQEAALNKGKAIEVAAKGK